MRLRHLAQYRAYWGPDQSSQLFAVQPETLHVKMLHMKHQDMTRTPIISRLLLSLSVLSLFPLYARRT